MMDPTSDKGIISTEQLVRALDNATILRLADVARIPHVNRPDFARGVTDAAFAYRDAVAQMTASAIHAQLGVLVKALRKALESRKAADANKVVETFECIPEVALSPLRQREQIEVEKVRRARARAERPDADALGVELSKVMASQALRIPTLADLRDAERRWRAMSDLYCLATAGAVVREGRLRPGGKRSRPTVEILVNAPPRPQHRPRDSAEAMLCATLGELYQRCSGRRPARRHGHLTSNEEYLGPFSELVKEILRLCCKTYVVNVQELVRGYTNSVKLSLKRAVMWDFRKRVKKGLAYRPRMNGRHGEVIDVSPPCSGAGVPLIRRRR